MRYVILYRNIDGELDKELDAARAAGFYVTDSRMDIQKDDLVIGRYSVLPFYREQDRDLRRVGARLINNPREHEYLADLESWYGDLSSDTMETWFRLEDIPEGGPFVLKGQTNSKRQQWRTHMYAETKKDAIQVAIRLQQDGLIGQQKICIRRFERLNQIADPDMSGLPISEEYRFFGYRGKILCGGFYWSSHKDDLHFVPSIDNVPRVWLDYVAEKIDATFFVVDVALDHFGKPVVVELNDGQMSGLSENDPVELYKKLMAALKSDHG